MGNFTRKSFMKLLYKEIIKSCENFGIMTGDKKLEKFLKTHNFKIKNIIDYHGIPIPFPDVEDDYAKLADFVMNLPQMIYEEYCHAIGGIFIFIDEFQLIKELDENLNSFLWYIRSFVQSQKNVAYLFSGSMGIKDNLIGDIAGKNGAFGGRILTFELNPFSFETTKNYLDEKAPQLKFSKDAFERFYKCTGGVPYYINTFAKLLPSDTVLDENDIILEFENLLPFLAMHFVNSWGKLTFQEQRIITSLVDKPLKRIEIANDLGVTSGAIGGSLNSLQDKLFIETESNYYQIADNIFKAWLKSEFDKKGVYPYRSF